MSFRIIKYEFLDRPTTRFVMNILRKRAKYINVLIEGKVMQVIRKSECNQTQQTFKTAEMYKLEIHT